MDEGQWCRIEQLFRQAAELPLAGQSDFLDRACGDDEELRREVESLLAADIPEDGLIQAAVARAAEQLPAESLEDSDLLGKRVGRYSITGLIGRGGMGSVYRAERQDDFQMQVAIKLLKRGTDTDTALSKQTQIKPNRTQRRPRPLLRPRTRVLRAYLPIPTLP